MSTFLVLNEKTNDFKLENTLFNIYQNVRLKISPKVSSQYNFKTKFTFDKFLELFENSVVSTYSDELKIEIKKELESKEKDLIYLGFDYSCESKDITDYTFWRVVTITINNEDYLYHKPTGCIIDVVEGEAYLYGIYKPDIKDEIVYVYSLPEFVIDWISNCSIKF